MRSRSLPVYTDLIKYIEGKIETGDFKVGERIPGENDLADKFNISRVSVRKGIKSLIDRHLLESQQGKGAFVTLPTEIRRKKEYIIGLVTRPIFDGAGMYLQVQNVISERFFMGNCQVRMLPMPESVDYFLKNNVASEIDYYVWLFPNEESFPIIKELSGRLNKPFILFDRTLPDSGDSVVSALLNEEFAVHQAVNLLANYGHKSSLFLYRIDRQYNLRRINLFKKALAEKRIALNPENIINTGNEPGYAKKAAEIIIEQNPDAALFSQGAICRDILPHLYSKGVMLPRDLSVITFDRVEVPYDMTITCIHSDYEKLAVLLVEYVIAKLREPDSDIALPVVQSDLILGESCAPKGN